jgi:hypothetical protein
MQRDRHREFSRFLNMIEGEMPAGKIIRVILDNYGGHKHPKGSAPGPIAIPAAWSITR